MTAIERPMWLLSVGGVGMRVGSVSLTMELGPLQTTVADITIASVLTASPAERTPVTLRYADLDTGEIWPVFSGYVLKPLGVSDGGVSIRCEGPLSLLRDTWDADTDFTGDSGGDVNKTAMTLSGISYDPSWIQDDSLSLGPIVAIKGTKRTARSVLVREVNRVLGMALVEIGGQPARFAYDLVPSVANIVRTYTRGVDGDFFGNERSPELGLDEQRNAFTVNGPSFSCGADDECRCTISGKGYASNSILGSGVRTEPVPESSDLFQTLSHIEDFLERQLRWYNRPGDHATIKTAFHPTQTIGQTIGIKDPWPGVNLTANALAMPYIITRMEIRDHDVVLQCTGGPAGNTGTITSTVEKRCNETVGTGTGGGGGFTPPPPIPPPIVPPPPGVVPVPPGTTPPTDEPFTGCHTEEHFCPEPSDDPDAIPDPDPPDVCLTPQIVADSCLGTPPADPCQIEGWHRSEWHDIGPHTGPGPDPDWDCTCHVETSLRKVSWPSIGFWTTADGAVEKVSTCSLTGDPASQLTVSFYLGAGNAYDTSYADDEPVHMTGPACVGFTFRFCHPGELIQIWLEGYDDAGAPHGPAHNLILYAEPGGTNLDVGGSNPRSINSKVAGAILSGDAEPHHSYSLGNRNSGGVDLGGGLPIGVDLHAQLCIETDGDNPRTFWSNGVNAGYDQHLPYLDERIPFPSTPDVETEPATDHAYHLAYFVLVPGGDDADGLCSMDCPGPQILDITSGSETCAPNEFFVPADFGGTTP